MLQETADEISQETGNQVSVLPFSSIIMLIKVVNLMDSDIFRPRTARGFKSAVC